MATSTQPRVPAAPSDDLDRALQREARQQTPAARRVTCPLHLNWLDRCRSWH